MSSCFFPGYYEYKVVENRFWTIDISKFDIKPTIIIAHLRGPAKDVLSLKRCKQALFIQFIVYL